MNATGCNISGNQNVGFAALEILQGALALGLATVAVNHRAVRPLSRQLARNAV